MRFPIGRFVKIDRNNPDAVAICDNSGIICNYSDLAKQMEYRGRRLVWTGLMVNKNFALDKPQPQNIPLALPPDPLPLPNPRPPEPVPTANKGSTILPYNVNIRELEEINFYTP